MFGDAPDELKSQFGQLIEQFGPPPESVARDIATIQQRQQPVQQPIGGGLFDAYSQENQGNLKMAMFADIIGNLAGRDVGATKGMLALAENARKLRLQNEQRTAAQNMLGGGGSGAAIGGSGLTPEQINFVKVVMATNPPEGIKLFLSMKQQAATAQAAVTKPISHEQMAALGYNPDPNKNYQIKNGKIMEIGGGITINQGTLTTKVDHLGRTYTTDNKSGITTPAIDPVTGEQILSSTANPGSFEAASYRFSERMNVAEDKLAQLEDSLETDDPLVGKDEALVGSVFGDAAQRMYMSPTQQIYSQAAHDWVSANLRQESGAAIPEDEVHREFKKYFPLPGETDPEVIANKRKARRGATSTMNDLGNVAREFYAHRKKRDNPATPSQQKEAPTPPGVSTRWKEMQRKGLINRRQ